MTKLIVGIFLFFFLLRLGVNLGLSIVNLRHSAKLGTRVPAPLIGNLDEAALGKSRAYTRATGRFGIVHALYGAALTLVALFSGLMPALENGISRLGLSGAHHFVAFLVALFGILSVADLPFGLYHTFGIETRFGFNRQTFKGWLGDQLKGLVVSAVIGLPLLYAVYGFMSLAGSGWWVWLFVFLVAAQAFLLWLYPSLIAPLFNKFSPLPDGPLKERLESLAVRTGFQNRGLFIMDASKRSGHSNAYFTGLFRPRIVLFDTLVNTLSVDEAEAVLAHEIGHYKGRHIQRRLVFAFLSLFLTLYALSLLVAWPALFQAFGFATPSPHVAIAIISLTGGAFTFFFQPISAWLSRRNEYEADGFANRHATVPAAMRTALIRLGGENLSNPTPHPAYVAWNYSHPTLLDRLAALEKTAPAT